MRLPDLRPRAARPVSARRVAAELGLYAVVIFLADWLLTGLGHG